jgi:hypothetical protein
MATGSWLTLAESSYPVVQVGDAIDFSDVLTPADKRLVMALTGYDADAPFDPSGDHGVPQLVAEIAIARALGRLTGPVTHAILERGLAGGDTRCAA